MIQISIRTLWVGLIPADLQHFGAAHISKEQWQEQKEQIGLVMVTQFGCCKNPLPINQSSLPGINIFGPFSITVHVLFPSLKLCPNRHILSPSNEPGWSSGFIRNLCQIRTALLVNWGC